MRTCLFLRDATSVTNVKGGRKTARNKMGGSSSVDVGRGWACSGGEGGGSVGGGDPGGAQAMA